MHVELTHDEIALIVDALAISGGFKSDFGHYKRCQTLAQRLAAVTELEPLDPAGEARDGGG